MTIDNPTARVLEEINKLANATAIRLALTCSEAGKLGGNLTKAKYAGTDYYSRIGKKGGAKVAERGSEYYSAIGKLGGETHDNDHMSALGKLGGATTALRGPEYFRRIGMMNKKTRRERLNDQSGAGAEK